jgi:hypothetical protein
MCFYEANARSNISCLEPNAFSKHQAYFCVVAKLDTYKLGSVEKKIAGFDLQSNITGFSLGQICRGLF